MLYRLGNVIKLPNAARASDFQARKTQIVSRSGAERTLAFIESSRLCVASEKSCAKARLCPFAEYDFIPELQPTTSALYC